MILELQQEVGRKKILLLLLLLLLLLGVVPCGQALNDNIPATKKLSTLDLSSSYHSHNSCPPSRVGPEGGDYSSLKLIFEATCPGGGFVTRFQGRTNLFIDSIKAVCSDGSVLGPFGSETRGWEDFATDEALGSQGFRGMFMRAADLIDSVMFISSSGKKSQMYGGYGGYPKAIMQCACGIVTGMFGKVSDDGYPIKIGIICAGIGEV